MTVRRSAVRIQIAPGCPLRATLAVACFSHPSTWILEPILQVLILLLLFLEDKPLQHLQRQLRKISRLILIIGVSLRRAIT